jgi:integrase
MRLQIKWVEGWAHIHGTGPDGKRIRRALKTRDARQAEEARAALEARLWKVGLYGAEHVITFEECALEYVQDGGEARFIVPISQALAGRRLKDITPKDIRDAARALYPDATPATLNRQAITPARAVINFGHSLGWCGAIKVKAFATEKPKRQAVTRAYLDAMRPHLPPPLFALMMFLHTTGRRVGDALSLDVTDVDLAAMQAVIGKTKNGDPATAYLTPEVADLLRGIMPEAGPVFPYASRGSLYATLRRACAKAKLPYLGTHQVGRHSYATTLSNAGWGSKAIADAGGWKSVRLVAETYEHPAQAGERAAAVIGKFSTSKAPSRRKSKPLQQVRNDV